MLLDGHAFKIGYIYVTMVTVYMVNLIRTTVLVFGDGAIIALINLAVVTS